MARLENMRKYQDTRLLPLRNRKNEKSLLNKIRNPSFKYAHLLGKFKDECSNIIEEVYAVRAKL
ncbi:hypothetical protein RirG_250740 [Rhizophagus irregularis DAOM 197198w]|uniref:Uncharacterized protein n=1 Tax=Rhizophagus irregularis (strain DAOM 197198w) TaxID=1432141 RepID=A0A015LCZ3_RHIIW|nr:hypothetical protein RirG_250740 [Rhizophagus irregularis DAOM 197198w]